MFIDVFFAVFLIYGIITGFSRGLIRSVLSLVAILLAVVIGLKLGPYLGDFIERSFHIGPMLSMLIGIVLCFVLIVWGVRLLSSSLEKGLQKLRLNFINKLAGAIVLGGFMFLLYGTIILFLDSADILRPEAKHASRTYPLVEEVPGYTDRILKLVSPIVDDVKERIDEYRAERSDQSGEPG